MFEKCPLDKNQDKCAFCGIYKSEKYCGYNSIKKRKKPLSNKISEMERCPKN